MTLDGEYAPSPREPVAEQAHLYAVTDREIPVVILESTAD